MVNNVQEQDLFLRYNAGKTPEVLEEIMEAYQHIPSLLSRRFAGKGLELDDIYQSACIGLMHAAKRFDTSRGVAFSTYATATVLGEIKRLFRDKKNCIRVPRHLYEIFSRANKIRNGQLVENGTLPDRDELAKQLGVSTKQLSQALYWGENRDACSLDQPIADGDALLADCIGIEDDEFLMIENKDFIDSFMRLLPEREQNFVRYRFYEEMTQSKIAELMNTSQTNISRMEKKVLDALRIFYEKSVSCG
ncbi:MAG: sigma-70 family RNA polymerase sigma factor [Ruminococcaceae bacterium]|nr:sigma-70 family RNA polymerase sigma factor [Oscillospiraceae bacterium]